jgi:hypothetical protein
VAGWERFGGGMCLDGFRRPRQREGKLWWNRTGGKRWKDTMGVGRNGSGRMRTNVSVGVVLKTGRVAIITRGRFAGKKVSL